MLNGDDVIITAPANESALSEFDNFRKMRFNVKLATTSQAGTDATAITDYIKGLSPTPSYLLLVGDVADIPSSNCSGRFYEDNEYRYYKIDMLIC